MSLPKVSEPEAEVRRILRSLRFSPNGQHHFAEQIMAHMRPDNVSAVIRVLALLCEYLDVGEEFARQVLAHPDHGLRELKAQPEVRQIRLVLETSRASGVEPPLDLMVCVRDLSALAKRELRRRGLGYLLEELH
ncbi:hypothetical protein [Mesorhizobium sp. LNJC395A00]|uniref:hypothetical protein n=1 Tax=Mesorhizobium sp. LNJC395A00 TaxID=1287275 RepID=UPI0003CE6728|nr:hypothetical protein [Mesorhizobium sp. LNJC395A00]ESY22385.1 hypothetical protein X751_05655 [Mesorhizobium sp. LNJC395A00]